MNSENLKRAFLGTGWAFPVSPDRGQINMVAHDEDIKQSIQIILGTNPGERLMRPDFGAGLNAFIFHPVTATILHRIRTRVEEALIDWEPRIDLERVAVTSEPADRAKVWIDVSYRVRATNTQANLVYPFYLQEGPAQ